MSRRRYFEEQRSGNGAIYHCVETEIEPGDRISLEKEQPLIFILRVQFLFRFQAPLPVTNQWQYGLDLTLILLQVNNRVLYTSFR